MARSKELVPGVGRLSRSSVFARRALYKGQKKSTKPAVAEVPATKQATVGGDKNGTSRVVPTKKAPRFYPAEDVRQPKKSRKSPKPANLRSSITPGTVLILLAGRFRGKRVVFLKQLASGLLLVTGPYKVNGVPLRRVNQAYVIASSTKVDLGDFKVCFFLHFKRPHFRTLPEFTQYRWMRSRLTRKSTTRTSLSPPPRALVPRKRSSSQRASPRRLPSRSPRQQIRRQSMPPSPLPSRRPNTSTSTLRRPSASQRASSLISSPSNWDVFVEIKGALPESSARGVWQSYDYDMPYSTRMTCIRAFIC